jgi:hypothetical protein
MIRLTLRQFRTEGVTGLVLLLALAVVLAATGFHLAQVYDNFRRACPAAGGCAGASGQVLSTDKPLQTALSLIVGGTPALIGLFFGAPLIARELETGTFRLAWTQSVTRPRWLAVKLGLTGVAAMALAGLVTWMAGWWASPLFALSQNRFGLASFSLYGVAPVGYAAFAFALGATAGVLLRRTVPAMAATLAGFAAARLAVTYWVRPYLAAPVRRSLPLAAGSGPGYGFGSSGGSAVALTPSQVTVPNGWVYSTAVVNKTGHAPTSQYLLHACPVLGRISRQIAAGGGTPASSSGQGPGLFRGCTTTLSATLHTVLTYQPASRFWPFQWAEAGLFLAGALALCGLAYWWLRRRYA